VWDRTVLSGLDIFYVGDGPYLSLQGMHHVTLRDCRIRRASGTGPLVRVSGGDYDSCFIAFYDCTFDGGCLDVQRTLALTIYHCDFINSNYGIISRGGVNGLTVHGASSFYNNTHGAIAALGMNQAWTVETNLFEGLADGRAGAFITGQDSVVQGFNWMGNWHGDVSKPGQAWIENAWLSGYRIGGNYFGTAGEQASMIVLRHCAGGEVSGNRFDDHVQDPADPTGPPVSQHNIGIQVDAASEAPRVGANVWKVQTPWTGSVTQ
jgi:hypothetical protein